MEWVVKLLRTRADELENMTLGPIDAAPEIRALADEIEEQAKFDWAVSQK